MVSPVNKTKAESRRILVQAGLSMDEYYNLLDFLRNMKKKGLSEKLQREMIEGAIKEINHIKPPISFECPRCEKKTEYEAKIIEEINGASQLQCMHCGEQFYFMGS